MGDQITPSKTLSFQLYHLEYSIYLCPATDLSQVYIFITSLFKISIMFLPPRQSASIPVYDNVFYSSFSKTKSHRGQREGQHCAELLCLLHELLMKSFGLPLVTSHAGDGQFSSPEKERSTKNLY